MNVRCVCGRVLGIVRSITNDGKRVRLFQFSDQAATDAETLAVQSMDAFHGAFRSVQTPGYDYDADEVYTGPDMATLRSHVGRKFIDLDQEPHILLPCRCRLSEHVALADTVRCVASADLVRHLNLGSATVNVERLDRYMPEFLLFPDVFAGLEPLRWSEAAAIERRRRESRSGRRSDADTNPLPE